MFLFAGWCIRWSLATLFFVLIMAGAGYYVLTRMLDGGDSVRVPDVTMRPITEASFLLAQQGLEIGKQTPVVDERVPKYYVIVQRPAAGKVVRTGRKVYLTVSAGTESLSPPNLIGTTLQSATEEIKHTSFSLGSVARIANASPRDTVIAQDPGPTRLVSSTERINLLLSDGLRPMNAFNMPDLYHKPVTEILQILAPFGVKPIPNPVDLPDQPFDVVLDQQPPAGTVIREGDRVVYSVRPSSGTTLPDAQRKVQISYTVPESWSEREVRVDTIDRNGIRTTWFPLEKHYVNGEPPKFRSGDTLDLPPFKFLDKMTVEIYLDGQLAESHYYEGDAEPVVHRFSVQ